MPSHHPLLRLPNLSRGLHHLFLMVICLPILNKETLLSSLTSYLLTVMFLLMVQCILESLLSLSSTMDLLHLVLMVI